MDTKWYKENEHYNVGKYPDGQIYVKVKKITTYVVMSISSYEDLFILKALCDAHFNYYSKNIELLCIDCLFGQRSDRRFNNSESFDLKIICDFINSCNFDSVSILEPHSDVALALINNSMKGSTTGLIKKSLSDIRYINTIDDVVLVSPDAGAYKKVAVIAEGFNVPMVSSNKTRDRTGKIDLIFNGEVKDQVCLIVDDLADGGYTFHLLAKALKESGAKKVYLYVTHGFFFKGFDLLKENIDGIYTTDSTRRTFEDNFVRQHKLESNIE